MTEPSTPQSVHAELERARSTFHHLASHATPSALRRSTDGTKWTNQQMLFHMLFGYLIVARLLWLVRLFGRLPERSSLRFSQALNAERRPFHVINYLGSCGGALVFRGPHLVRRFDRIISALHRHLDRETNVSLCLRMHFPVDWDPYFHDTMTLLDVYHYGTQHFDFHAQQLTLAPNKTPGPTDD